MITILECTARECVYNKNECCCRDGITVKGSQARCTEDTCCGDFHDKGKEGYRNSCGCNSEMPKRGIEIACDAENCKYNDDRRCLADRIGIGGTGVREGRLTECTTFRPR